MQKKLAILIAVMMTLGLASTAFSATNEGTTAGEAISLTDGLTTPNNLVLNFSPSVNATYGTDSADTAGNKQWYVVAAYHSGGGFFYGSSSDSTSIYKQERTTNQTFSAVTMPTAASTTDATTETTTTAEDVWTSNGWDR